MMDNLLDPLFSFFLVGFVGGVLKSDLKLPEAVYHLLSTYLLLSIGLKGGVQLAHTAPRRSPCQCLRHCFSVWRWHWGYFMVR